MDNRPVEHDRRTEILAEVVTLAAAGGAAGTSARKSRISSTATTGRSIPRISPSARRPTSTAPRCRNGNSRASATPGHAKVRVFNPTRDEHGWQSTHTIVEIVNDDMPFLVDSVTMEVNRHGLTQHLIIHPIVAVERDAAGTLVRLVPEGAGAGRAESFIHVEVDRISDPDSREALAADLLRVLADVRAAVDDWRQDDGEGAAPSSPTSSAPSPPLPPAEVAEGVAFLRWLADNHFTFLGYRSYDLDRVRGTGRAAHRAGLEPRHPARQARQGGRRQLFGAAAGGPRLRAAAGAAGRHQVDGALDRAPARLPRLHRGQALRRRGQVCGEHRFLGLFTSTAYSANAGRHPAPAAQDRGRRRAGRSSRRQPRRQDARQHPRNVSARRAVPDAARTTCCARRWRSCISATASAFACSCAAIRSSASCRASSTRRARTTRPSCGRSGRRSSPRRSTGPAPISTSTCPSRCWRASRSRCARRRARFPPIDVRDLEARLAAAARRWTDDLRAALIDARGRGARQRALPPLRRARSRPAIARTSRRARRLPTSR